jgi:hypothetical protein
MPLWPGCPSRSTSAHSALRVRIGCLRSGVAANGARTPSDRSTRQVAGCEGTLLRGKSLGIAPAQLLTPLRPTVRPPILSPTPCVAFQCEPPTHAAFLRGWSDRDIAT